MSLPEEAGTLFAASKNTVRILTRKEDKEGDDEEKGAKDAE